MEHERTLVYIVSVLFEDGSIFGTHTMMITSSELEAMRKYDQFDPMKYLVENNFIDADNEYEFRPIESGFYMRDKVGIASVERRWIWTSKTVQEFNGSIKISVTISYVD